MLGAGRPFAIVWRVAGFVGLVAVVAPSAPAIAQEITAGAKQAMTNAGEVANAATRCGMDPRYGSLVTRAVMVILERAGQLSASQEPAARATAAVAMIHAAARPLPDGACPQVPHMIAEALVEAFEKE